MIGRTSSTVTTRFCSLALAGRSVYSSACCLSRVPGWAGTPSMRFRWPIFGFGQCRLLGFWTSPSPKLIPDEVVVDEEILPSYEPEHFYPAHPGDVLENGYRLVVKIGWGSSSTVWLAYKTRWYQLLPSYSLSIHVPVVAPYELTIIYRYNWFKPRKYVALKLCTCNISDEDIAYELDMNRHLSSANPQFPGRDVLATAFEGCTIKSPQGDAHLALVFELLREPLGLFRKRVTLRKQLDLNALPLMKAYILILLEGLDYMHSQAHVVHTGESSSMNACHLLTFLDLKLDNIMVTFEHQSTITKFVQQQKSHPMPCKKLGNRTVYLCHNDFGPVMKGLGNMIPQITDFDLSQRGDKNLLIHPIQPDELRAPEVLLGTGWSYSADMWNFGVIVSC